MYILGISCFYHDASATLLKDGKIVAAAQEERFTRKKHDASFPEKAIRYCLASQNISINDVDSVAFYEKPLLKFERLLSQHLEMFPWSYKTFLFQMPSWFKEKLRVLKFIKKNLGYKKDVFFVEHHLAHAASSFFPSPFKRAAIFTIDGVGEWTTTACGVGENTDIQLSKEIQFPHSLGLLYSTITAYLGFSVNNSEYKVMGLAPYGDMNKETNKYYQKLKQVIELKNDGSYRLDMGYFSYHYANKMPSKKLSGLLGGEIRKPEEELTQRHKDIAAALQLVTEEVMISILNYLYSVTRCENVVLSGGVALNSVANGKLLKNTPFKNIWINPDPGDGGTSIGAALYAHHVIFGNKKRYLLENAYLGSEFSKEEIKNFLDGNKIKYSQFKNEWDLVKNVAKLIYENNVVGWFQGRMEFGPRALGARSILSNPCNPEMKEILNTKVKHREKFRPFAPVVCAEQTSRYFQCDAQTPSITDFMLMVYPIKKKWQKNILAVTHIDGSGRLQTIHKKQNPRYYNLIREFEKLSKIPILINTSFNIRGEPIVCAPFDAYRCMMGTGIDILVMDTFLIWRKDNMKDIWDSEMYAQD